MATKKMKAASAESSGKTAGNIYAVVAYILGILGALIVIFTQKKDKFAMFHAKQSLVISIAWILLGVLIGIGSLITAVIGMIPVLGWVIAAILGVVILILSMIILPLGLLVYLWGAWKAYSGAWYRFPVVADYADKLNI